VSKIFSAAGQLQVGPVNHFGPFHQSSHSFKNEAVTPLDPTQQDFLLLDNEPNLPFCLTSKFHSLYDGQTVSTLIDY
jgi:hypothetical protein